MYPTEAHARAATSILAYFQRRPGVWAVVLTGSLGCGRGLPDSDIDMAIFHDGPFDLAGEAAACARAVGGATAQSFGVVLGGIRVDLEPTGGCLQPRGGLLRLDPLELDIGNLAIHAAPLWDPHGRWSAWRGQFLPYLPDALRAERMAAVAADFRHNLAEVGRMAARSEFFEALQRLVYAQRYLLHYLCLRARVYPVDYTKHVAWQCRELLGAPELADALQDVLAVGAGRPEMVAARVGSLADLWRRYAEG